MCVCVCVCVSVSVRVCMPECMYVSVKNYMHLPNTLYEQNMAQGHYLKRNFKKFECRMIFLLY